MKMPVKNINKGEKHQSSSPWNMGQQFQQSVTSATNQGNLAVKDVLIELSTDNNEYFQKQLDVDFATTANMAHEQIEIGDQEFAQALSQGIASFLQGSVSIFLAAYPCNAKAEELKDNAAKTDNANKYMATLDTTPEGGNLDLTDMSTPEHSARTTDMLKDGYDFGDEDTFNSDKDHLENCSTQDKADIKENVKKYIEKRAEEQTSLLGQKAQAYMVREMWSQGISGLSQGIGGGIGGAFLKIKAQLQAKLAIVSNVQQVSLSMVHEYLSMMDQWVQQADASIQMIQSINSAHVQASSA